MNVDLYARGLASDVYSRTRRKAQFLVLKGSSGKMECVVARSAIVFGPGSRRSVRLIESFVRDRVWVLPVPSRRFCPVYSADLDIGVVQAAAKARPGNTYTIAGNCVTLRQFIDELARVSGRRDPRLSIPGWLVIPGLSVAWAIRPVTRWTPPVTVEGVNHGHIFDGSAAGRTLNLEDTPFDRAPAATVEALRLKRA